MVKGSISLGTKNKDKIKREIDFTVEYKHIFLFFGALMLLVLAIIQILGWLGASSQLEYVICDDGSKDYFETGKEIYCGVHYTTLAGSIKDSTYSQIEDFILYGVE